MNVAVELAEEQLHTEANDAHNDNRPAVEIAPELVTGIPPERLDRAVRLLARRIVDLAMADVEESTNGNY